MGPGRGDADREAARDPAGLRVVGIGGATLGGAGKTPVAIAVARALAASVRVVLVAHAYLASPGRARRVDVNDEPGVVGDDALAAARALAGSGVDVVVAPTREAALRFASNRDVAIVDGLLQASPRQVDHAVLVLDGDSPWGSGFCPPAGDLRAPRAALLAAADHVVSVGGASGVEGSIALGSAVESAVSRAEGEVRLAELRSRDLGVVLAVAHPERVLRSLAAAGVRARVVVRLADHARLDAAKLARHRVDAWLTTERCATKLPDAIGLAPVFALRHVVDVAALVPRLG